jgi:hypothetical protein
LIEERLQFASRDAFGGGLETVLAVLAGFDQIIKHGNRLIVVSHFHLSLIEVSRRCR